MSGPIAAVLGPVRLPGRSGAPEAVPGVLARRLVVALALAGSHGRSAAALADDVWTEDAPRNPRAALQMLVSRLRATTADDLLLSTPAGYRLAGSDLADAEAVTADDGIERLSAALATWRGEPGDDLDDPVLAGQLADRAARARTRLLSARGRALIAAGGAEQAIADARTLTALHPYDSAPVALRMRALAAAGRPTEALAAFAEHRERLAEDLGTDPDPDLVELHTTLLRGSPASRAELVGVRVGTDPLLGRDADLVALDAALAGARLVTVLGPGGLGKTRIAHEVAARQGGRFGRVVFVELAGTATAEDVAVAVGQAAGARGVRATRRASDIAGPDLATRTVDALAASRTLLVLDNCEHVVEAAAALADDLLGAVPDLVVLTTSRIPLLVPGELVHPLPPLPTETDASELFVRRARAARPDVRLDDEAVVRVVGHLDGLPLAIELAAARLRSMTLDELESRLDDRFALLVGGSRTAPERHRTLFAVIDWSWRLLPEEHQRSAALLGVFPDGFAARAADVLLGRDAEGLLVQLVDQSLLTFTEDPRGGAGRYRMLETVREFALAALERAGELDDALVRLDSAALDLIRRIAPGLTGGADVRSFRSAATEEETLRVLVRRAAPRREPVVMAGFALLTEFWVYRGEFETVLEFLPVAAAAAARRPVGEAEHEELVRALTLAAAFSAIGEPAGGVRLLALLRRAVRTMPPGAGGSWVRIAALVLDSGPPSPTSPGLTAAVGSPDPVVAILAALGRSQLWENRGRPAEALVDSERAERLAERHGYAWFALVARMGSAQLLSQRGDRAAALRIGLAAEQDAFGVEEGGDFRQTDLLIGLNQVATGDVDAAEERFERIVALPHGGRFDEANDEYSSALAGLAEVATARGDQALRAERWATAAEASRIASSPWTALIRAAAVADAIDRGDRATALRLYRRLRYRTLAVIRMGEPAPRFDQPVLASSALAMAVVLLGEPAGKALGERLGVAALAAGARIDLPALEVAARRFPPPDRSASADRSEADPIATIEALLRDRAARL